MANQFTVHIKSQRLRVRIRQCGGKQLVRRYLATVNDREAVSKVRQHLLAAGRDEDGRSEVQAEDVGSGMMRELPLIV